MTSPDVIAIGRRATARQFMDDEFLLESRVASDLYHRFAEPLPIIDYHSHLPPEQLATDHRFRSITEIWLDGDHYKWRAMRANGVAERFITGNASDWERFEAWARTVPDTRPQSALSLDASGAAAGVRHRCAAVGRDRARRSSTAATRGCAKTTSRCLACCAGSASPSSAPPTIRPIRWSGTACCAARPELDTRVYPTWRSDQILAVEDPARLQHVGRAARGGVGLEPSADGLSSLLDALRARHDAFHELGCRSSDLGLEAMVAEPWDDQEVDDDFDRLRCGQAARRREGATLQVGAPVPPVRCSTTSAAGCSSSISARCATPTRAWAG